MKKSVLFSILALTASVFADGDLEATAQKMNGKPQQQEMKNNNMMSPVVLTSARPESDNGWYLFADALYWHADVGNADWSEKHQITDAGAGAGTYNVHHLDFKWSWGFKVGIGVNIDHDMWDSSFSYTWFRTENSNAIGLASSVPAGTIQGASSFLPPGSAIESAKHKWSIHFSMFDWELGRWQYSSKSLALRPHVGIKGGWINQDRKTSSDLVSGGSTILGNFKNNFWGVGPSAGLNTMWVLGNAGSNMDHRFSLFGDVAGALMYGHFNNTYRVNPSSNVGDPSQNIKNLNRNLAVPMLQAMMGLSWDTAFNRGRNHFMMKVGYEFQYWFRQNQYLSTSSVSTSIVGPSRYSDDLALQGLTTEFRFDF